MPRWTWPPAGTRGWSGLRSPEVFTSVSHIFVMEWAAVLGGHCAGAGAFRLHCGVGAGCFLAAFLSGWTSGAGALVGTAGWPLVALVSFVCSVGNVPLAAVLWQHGLSFGGVIAFLFGDLIILPIVNIHRKYYWLARGAAAAGACSMRRWQCAALAVEWIFIRAAPDAGCTCGADDDGDGFRWDHTAVLNLVFLAIARIAVAVLPLGRGGYAAAYERAGRRRWTTGMHHAAHHHGAMR